MKRRKKTTEEAASQPAPLQPAYFEPGEAEPEAAVEASENEAPEAPAAAPPAKSDDEAGGDNTPEAADGQTSSGTRHPRRRRRGGRGRRRSGQGAPQRQSEVAAASEPAAVAEEPAARPSAPAPVASSHPRPSKGTVILAIGLPGSGKSSWFKRHNITPLSSDLIRALLFDDPTEQRFQDLVFSNLRSMLRARLVARRPLNYVDATNLTPHDRHSWIKLAKDFGYEVQAVYFDVPLEVCLERNARRPRVVEDDVMRKMAAKLKPPTFEEGFSKITVVRVKAKE
ncbi:MAG TPA: AAA family ATPase [Terriglobales bacterium]